MSFSSGSNVLASIDQTPERVAESIKDVLIEHGLRRIQAVTDTHVIEVEEPSIWEDMEPLKTTIREIGL